MTDAVVWLPPEEIPPGTPLAADLTDEDGTVLLTAGTRLEVHRLAILVRQGITRLPVAPLPPPAAAAPRPVPEQPPASPEVAAGHPPPNLREEMLRAQLEQRFALAGESPASQALFRTLLAYRLQRQEA